MPRTIIVFADRFDENNGGVIALHRLCDVLNRDGQRAFLWPSRRPLYDAAHPFRSAWGFWRYYRRAWRKPLPATTSSCEPRSKRIRGES